MSGRVYILPRSCLYLTLKYSRERNRSYLNPSVMCLWLQEGEEREGERERERERERLFTATSADDTYLRTS